jgi:hypothetical protein
VGRQDSLYFPGYRLMTISSRFGYVVFEHGWRCAYTMYYHIFRGVLLYVIVNPQVRNKAIMVVAFHWLSTVVAESISNKIASNNTTSFCDC